MSTGPHVIPITLSIAWLDALVAALAITVGLFMLHRGRTANWRFAGWISLCGGTGLLWVSVLIQILYWLGIGD